MTPSKPDEAKPSSSGDPEVGDPVAALEAVADALHVTVCDWKGSEQFGVTHGANAAALLERLAEQGYVLVNAEGLAAALHRAYYDDELTAALVEDGEGLPEWRRDLDNNVEWYDSPNEMAAAILAAIQEQAGGER